MRRLLVTGGAGFIGANFVRYWLLAHPADQVVVLDALTYAGNLANLESLPAEKLTFVQGSISDQALVERLLREHGLDTLVHFAAESHVDRSILGPDAFIETNIVGTHTLLKAARAVWLDEWKGLSPFGNPVRFHHVSTDEVYGTLKPEDPPFTESTAYAPNSPYAASKAASDHLVRAYTETYGLPVSISNCSNNYGPYHFPEKLIPLIITNILDDKELPIYGDGLQIRDWLYVTDHCRGIELVLEANCAGENFNIGGNNEWTNIAIVHTLCELLDAALQKNVWRQQYPQAKHALSGRSKELMRHVHDRPGHDRRYAIDAQKSRTVLGFEPQESFASGIAKTVDWYLENEPWWRAVQTGSYRQWIALQYAK